MTRVFLLAVRASVLPACVLPPTPAVVPPRAAVAEPSVSITHDSVTLLVPEIENRKCSQTRLIRTPLIAVDCG